MNNSKNLFYAQSGGATAVINTTACGVIETARQKEEINNVFVGHDGIIGALAEELIDTSLESAETIRQLYHTPGSAFGSCRYKLPPIGQNDGVYQRLFSVFEAHDIHYFLYNGGGDSQDTTNKVSIMSKKLGYPLKCIGLPKTIDNDLMHTDNCPGFGSAAKYIATSIKEAALDVAGMARTSTKVFLMEIMGRNAGWLAAAAGLATEQDGDAPHIILFPEIAFNEKRFLQRVKKVVQTHGACTIAISEGLRDEHGDLLIKSSSIDAFGHVQLGGIASKVAALIKHNLGYKYHWALPDYLQRAGRHLGSKADVEQAYAIGQAAVDAVIAEKDNIMLAIERTSNSPYQWQVGEVCLNDIANHEKFMPREFISEDGYHITDACRNYMAPLIAGECIPPFKNGLPVYARLKKQTIPPKLSPFEI
ncbi:6-phosphofructokinase 1 [Piscirickettsia salmonis]|uniref:6-phosphofructokinase n=1 Tax=Piscirickettsia salmonis TaxID=1238 RepID=UPI0012B8C344|nr:6-phosphofructokinase [Piscirickettsia salmonis]QGP51499.1 6-phosphofructokinase 1 [Piscirickettsia salmonis]